MSKTIRQMPSTSLGLLCVFSAIVLSVSSAGAVTRGASIINEGPGQLLTQEAAYDRAVERIQRQLNRPGYAVGPTDGVMGGRTRDAIRAYQRDEGLLVAGQPTRNLLDHMTSSDSAEIRSGQGQEEIAVGQLQRMLDRLGYDVAATGRMDSQTEAAIRAYQRDHDLLVTGRATAALSRHVRAQAREAGGSGGALSTSAGEIADIQRGLRQRGYVTGGTSGRMTPETREAIRDYQRDRGLEITGRPSGELAEMLREGVAETYQSRDTIRAVQRALNARGYSAGPADGVMGPSTREAIREYKAANDLPADDDTVTAGLLRSLELESALASGQDGSAPSTEGYGIRMRDSFNDGDFTGDPAWQVLSGEFTVENGKLHSRVEKRVEDKDFGKELLGEIFSQTLGIARPGQSDAAAIAQASPFGNAFRIEVRVSGDPDNSARVNLGPYQADTPARGYRLVYDSASDQPLSLMAVDQESSRTIASTSQVPRLANGEFHRVEWTRDPGGEMRVMVDGALAFAVRDQSFRDSFSGFSLINGGGEWQVDEVTIRSAD